MANICLETVWANRLVAKGWSTRAAVQLKFAWADSTRMLYNGYLRKLENFCAHQGSPFPPASTGVIAEFLCVLADSSDKPSSALKSATAALSNLYDCLCEPNPVRAAEITLLKSALVKSGTTSPRQYSKVMPITPFRQYFQSLPVNEKLPIKDLRMKVISLLALAMMLRPSDIAPKSKVFHPSTLSEETILFTVDQITFKDDGSATIQLFGTKNDLSRSGSDSEKIPAHPNPAMDPVAALRCYIQRTDHIRPVDKRPVFLSLLPPYQGITSSTVAQVMETCIHKVGLGNQGFSAKSFRPTGATTALEAGTNPDIVMKLGRWKTREVFYEHYVHSQTPSDYCATLFSHD